MKSSGLSGTEASARCPPWVYRLARPCRGGQSPPSTAVCRVTCFPPHSAPGGMAGPHAAVHGASCLIVIAGGSWCISQTQCHESGRGVERDTAKALVLFSLKRSPLKRETVKRSAYASFRPFIFILNMKVHIGFPNLSSPANTLPFEYQSTHNTAVCKTNSSITI